MFGLLKSATGTAGDVAKYKVLDLPDGVAVVVRSADLVEVSPRGMPSILVRELCAVMNETGIEADEIPPRPSISSVWADPYKYREAAKAHEAAAQKLMDALERARPFAQWARVQPA